MSDGAIQLFLSKNGGSIHLSIRVDGKFVGSLIVSNHPTNTTQFCLAHTHNVGIEIRELGYEVTEESAHNVFVEKLEFVKP